MSRKRLLAPSQRGLSAKLTGGVSCHRRYTPSTAYAVPLPLRGRQEGMLLTSDEKHITKYPFGGNIMELKVLAVGDVVGEPGLERIRKSLRKL